MVGLLGVGKRWVQMLLRSSGGRAKRLLLVREFEDILASAMSRTDRVWCIC